MTEASISAIEHIRGNILQTNLEILDNFIFEVNTSKIGIDIEGNNISTQELKEFLSSENRSNTINDLRIFCYDVKREHELFNPNTDFNQRSNEEILEDMETSISGYINLLSEVPEDCEIMEHYTYESVLKEYS